LVAVGEKIFALGGIYNVNSSLAFQLSSCEMLDKGASNWTKAPSLPVARMAGAAGVVGTRIVLTGGYCGLNEGVGGGKCPPGGYGGTPALGTGLSRSVIILDTTNLQSARWRTVQSMLVSRFGHAVAVAGQRVFALGGGFEDRPAVTTPTVEEYDLTRDKWVAVPNMTTPRYQLAAVALLVETDRRSQQAAASKSDDTRTPAGRAFSLLWNVPWADACRAANHSIDVVNFAAYGIRTNPDLAFNGPAVATLYPEHTGTFPFLQCPSGCPHNCPAEQQCKAVNNGLPQLVNMTSHLQKWRSDIVRLFPDPLCTAVAALDW